MNMFIRKARLLESSVRLSAVVRPSRALSDAYISEQTSTTDPKTSPEAGIERNHRKVTRPQKRRVFHRDDTDKGEGPQTSQKLLNQLPVEDIFGGIKKTDNLYQKSQRTSGKSRRPSNRKQTGISGEELANTFGLLADKDDLDTNIETGSAKFAEDEGEEDEFEKPFQRLSATHRRNTPDWYGKQMEKLLEAGKVYEAIEVLEVQMIKEDRVKPNAYVYSVLVSGLGRVGYTKKAFQLFNQMKKHGIVPNDQAYTALFNACANSPWKADGLQRARDLYMLLRDQDYEIAPITYRAAIKVFARHGDIATAFSLADDVRADGVKIGPRTYSMLLMACVSDTSAGFKHAIEVWRRMRSKKVTPNIYHYNLLLRTARECGVGGPEYASQLIQSRKGGLDTPRVTGGTDAEGDAGTPGAVPGTRRDNTLKLDGPVGIEEGDGAVVNATQPDEDSPHKSWWEYDLPSTPDASPAGITTVFTGDLGEVDESPGPSVLDMAIPNILNPRGRFDDIVSLGSLETREERLALLGGLPGIVSHIRRDGAVPTVQTFTMLVDLLPGVDAVESDLLAVMKSFGVQPDAGFFNQMIRKRNLRNDYAGAKKIVAAMGQQMIAPDIKTYGCLAMGCRQMTDGLALLRDVENAGVFPTVDLFSILVFQSGTDFWYKHALCRAMKRLEVAPNARILQLMESSVATGFKNLMKYERGIDVSTYYSSERFREGFRTFMLRYKPWLKSMPLDKPGHPWEAYRNPTPSPEGSISQELDSTH